jgi:hypothetical protein
VKVLGVEGVTHIYEQIDYLLIFEFVTLLEILSFVIIHYVTSMQLVVIYNYFGHVCNYKFGIV